MRIAIYGAGAIGGYLGVLLKRAGADVSLIARGEHLDAIRCAASPSGSMARRSLRACLQLPSLPSSDRRTMSSLRLRRIRPGR